MDWQPAAHRLCGTWGIPAGWVAVAAESGEVDSLAGFERWALERLASVYAGRHSEPAIGGDLAAWIVQHHLARSAKVLAWKYRLRPEEWEDVIGDVTLQALRAFREREIDAVAPYLRRTLERAIWAYLRRARREQPQDDIEGSELRVGPEDGAAWRQLYAIVRERCLPALSRDDRRLLEALEGDGRSAQEVGAELGLTANAVHVRKFRVRAKLRDCLRRHAGVDHPLDGD